MVKLVVALVTGSIGVLSEAIHSMLDLISSLVTFFVIQASTRPADWDHPFGHEKLENISALFEAFLLLLAGGYIIYEGIIRWQSLAPIAHVNWALIVTGASAIINMFVYFQNRGVAREEESIAIETNSFHFLTDAFSSLGVFLALGILHITGWFILDPLVAFLIALYIFIIAIAQMRKCIHELSDMVLPHAEIETIKEALQHRKLEFLNYHDLRTRKASSMRYVEMHLTVCSEQKVEAAHAVCDRIEEDLMKHFKAIQVNIHVEPCGTHSSACLETCRFYNKPRSQVK